MKNLVSFAAGDVAGRLVGFLITVYLARVLELSAFGIINIGLSVFGYLVLLGNPGIQLLETRNAAAYPGADENRVQAVLSLRFVLAAVLLAGITFVTWLISISSLTGTVIVLFCLSLVPLALLLDWFFHGKEQFGLTSAAKVINSLSYGAAVVFLVRSTADVVWVPVSFAIGNCLAMLFLLLRYWHRYGSVRFTWQPREWKTILVQSVPVGFAAFLAQSAMNLPPIALGWFVSTAEAGVFSAALKIVFVLLMLDRILNALLLPVLTRYFSSRRDDVSYLLSVITKFVLIGVLPLTVCGVLLSPLAIAAVFGDGYAEAAPILQILMMYFLLTICHSLFVCTLIAAGKEKEYTFALNAGSIVFVVGIVAGTFLAGGKGTAFGVVVGELCTLLLMRYQMKKVVEVRLQNTLLRPVIAGAVMIACAAAMNGQQILLQVTSSLLAFVIALVLSRSISATEIQFLREKVV
jgi:O-antigen/teichoic acid export membrane protein